MGFMGAWGFDPEESVEAMAGPGDQPDLAESSYSSSDERAARIPLNVWSQVYELRRMFRL